ncbi:MAG: helix-turn-helix transcriptional regulator [Candidatus Dormibacteria bacterium]
MDQTETEDRIAAFSSLADPTRRRLYLYTISRPEGAGRDEAAEAVGISRGLAAFHLDRLIADGLLVADYRRLTGRTGPGAGRPAKIYRRSERELSFSVPRRNHELLARLFAQAMSSTTSDTPLEALMIAAAELGASLGSQARRLAGGRAGRQRLLEGATAVLRENGFEPRTEGDDCLVLGNCPFSPLAGEYTDLVCRANLSLMEGLAAGLRIKGVEPVLDPKPGMCCVTFQRVARATPAGETSVQG